MYYGSYAHPHPQQETICCLEINFKLILEDYLFNLINLIWINFFMQIIYTIWWSISLIGIETGRGS